MKPSDAPWVYAYSHDLRCRRPGTVSRRESSPEHSKEPTWKATKRQHGLPSTSTMINALLNIHRATAV
ncbi:MAG: hypothetical protein VX834_13155 [Myxococcota bacterium]|nr:hypothetical protein [Myxococcota bacterium]